MSSKWQKIAIVAIMVLMFAFTVSVVGCVDYELPDEPIAPVEPPVEPPVESIEPEE
jgi:hypothetical protein